METKDTVMSDEQTRDLLETYLGKIYPKTISEFVDFMTKGIEVTKRAQAKISLKAGQETERDRIIKWLSGRNITSST